MLLVFHGRLIGAGYVYGCALIGTACYYCYCCYIELTSSYLLTNFENYAKGKFGIGAFLLFSANIGKSTFGIHGWCRSVTDPDAMLDTLGALLRSKGCSNIIPCCLNY